MIVEGVCDYKCLMVILIDEGSLTNINPKSKNKEYPQHAVEVSTFWSARSGSV